MYDSCPRRDTCTYLSCVQELGVQKIGHVKRFQNAIKLLKEESNDSVQETRDVCSTEVDTM